MHASPPRPRSVRPDLPEKLDEILLKSLEKDRELRYQSAAELRGDLKRLLRESGEAAKLASPSPAPASTSSPPPPASSDGALAIGLLRRHPRTVGVVALVVAAAAAALWWALARSGPATARNSEVSLQPLTFHGLAGDTTISADGKFIAYTRQNGTESSVVVRQLSSDSDVVILPPRAGVSYYAPSVTPDGGYVDVLEVDASITFKTRVLRVPLLGGAPRQLLGDGVRSGIGWSADGQRMVFNRSDAPAENSIVIADAQGQNLRVLATRRAPSFFINVTFGRRAARPAWSPDGRRIAALGLKNSPDGIDQHLVEIDVETGSERVMHRFVAASEVAYLDQDRWLASAVQPETMTVPWEVIPRQGSPVAITRDLSLLRGVQLTTDRSTGVALRTTLRSAIAVGAIAGADFAQAIEESGTEPGNAALDGAGNVFYSMRTSDGFAVFRRAREGGASTLIVRNLARPVPSNDGTFLFGRRLNVGMIRASVDGSDARVVLEDASADPLALSRDNRTLVLQSNRGGHQQPWRLSLETAAVERLSERSINGGQLWLSPDERQVIFTTTGGGAPGPTLCAFPSFDPCRLVNMIPGPLSPDGKRVYGISRADPANILMQPLDGGTPTPLTRFTDRRIRDFSVSPDGTRMAITRGMETSDVVLFKGLK